MMHYNELAPVPSDHLVANADRLRLAVAAYLARFKGGSRDHTHSDLRCYLAWCAERGLDPLGARCPRTLRLMMAATLTMRMRVQGKAPPVVFRRGFGVRGGGLVVSLP
jgi:hypothetical protein